MAVAVKVLVYPHDLGMGGSQLNAIELAARTRDLGHEVVVYGGRGALVQTVRDLGLEYVEAPTASFRPSPAVVRDLVRLARARGLDVLHGYEWPPGLECFLAAGRTPAVAVTTVMSMAVAPFLPHAMPLVVGTEQIADRERARGRRLVSVLEPPVDTALNAPGAAGPFAADGWTPDERPAVVVVSRLVPELKLEGILAAVEAVGRVNAVRPVRLLIVGDGAARTAVERAAARVNAVVGPGTVVLVGELMDPRSAYDQAAVAIGMGGSALRAMAFGKPLVVQGEEGFFRLLSEESLPLFLWQGWYGRGGTADPVGALSDILLEVLSSADLRSRLGGRGRALVEERFSLDAAARRQVALYEEALASPADRSWADSTRSVVGFARHKVRRRIARAVGRASVDDFNAVPLAGAGTAAARGAVTARSGLDPELRH